MNEAIQKEKIKVKDGRFVKGQMANPSGKNGYTLVTEIEKALNSQCKRQGYKDFPKFVAERALASDTVLVAVLKKICPDLIQGEGFGDTTNIYNLINRIQQDFVSKNSKSSVELDRGNCMDTGRTRPSAPIQEISEQRIS